MTNACYRLILLGFLICVSNVVGATYYVAKNGNDSNPGTSAQPVLTVRQALNLAQAGDTIRIGPGQYEEHVSSVRNGTSSSRITIDGQGSAVIQQISLSHSHITLQNLTVSGTVNQFSSLLRLLPNAHYAVITNCVVKGVNASKVHGISWNNSSSKPFGNDAASNVLVISNRITGLLASTAISISGDNNLIVGNYVHDLGQADFVRLWGRNNVIRNNTFTNIFTVEGEGNHIDFIQTFGEGGYGSMGHVIEGNLVIDIAGGQLTQLETYMVPEIRDWTFRNNIFVNIAAGASCTIPDVKYYNNVFYRCNYGTGSHVLSFGSRTYAHGTSYAHNGRVLNNVFLGCGDSRNTVGWYSFRQELTNVVADHNYVGKLDYSPVEQDAQKRPIGSSSGWATWGGWWEPGGVNGGNPLFVSELNRDFRLREASPLIGKALPLNHLFPADIRGTTRGAQWDIGAFEFAVGETVLRPSAPGGLRLLPQ